MKQLWTAAVLLAVLVTGLLLLSRTVDGLVTPLLEDLSRAEQAAMAGEWETAGTLTRQAAQAWEAADGRLRLAEPHQTVGEIAALLDEAALNAEGRDPAAYRAALRRAVRALVSLREAERVSLGNLF